MGGAPSRLPFAESANATAEWAVRRAGPSAVLDAASVAPAAGLRAYMTDEKVVLVVPETCQGGASAFLQRVSQILGDVGTKSVCRSRTAMPICMLRALMADAGGFVDAAAATVVLLRRNWGLIVPGV